MYIKRLTELHFTQGWGRGTAVGSQKKIGRKKTSVVWLSKDPLIILYESQSRKIK